MMNVANLPPESVSGVLSLLALLADPDGFKQRMTDLQAATDEATAAVTLATQAHLDANARINEASVIVADAARLKTQTDEYVAGETERCARRVAELDAREKDLTEREAAFDGRSKSAQATLDAQRSRLDADRSDMAQQLQARAAALDAREKAINELEQAVETKLADADALITAHTAKVAAAQEAIRAVQAIGATS